MKNSLSMAIILQALGEINRLKIIKFIGADECSVSQIIREINLSQPLVSHHLRILRENRILTTTRKGPFIYYKLSNTALLEILAQFEKTVLIDQFESYQPLFLNK